MPDINQVFQVDRICFDRSIWSVYFPSVVKRSDQIRFDTDLVDRLNLEDRLKETIFKGMGREKVYYMEKGAPIPYSKYELRLRGTRSFNIYFNFNRYFIFKNEYKHDIKCPVIHDDNFLPLDSEVGLADYLELFNKTLPETLKQNYYDLYSRFWPEDPAVINGEDPVVKCTTLEVGREMFPLDVKAVRNDLAVKGVHFKSFNDQSKTLYFGEAPEGLKYKVDGADMCSDLDCWNWRSDGKPKQGKLYQKSIDLARFEVTLYKDQIEFGRVGIDNQEEGVKFILQNYAEDVGISFVPREYNYDKMVEYISIMLKLDKSTIGLLLSEGQYWKANKKNRVFTQKLKRRGLVMKDSRGLWIVNPALINLFEKYVMPKGDPGWFIPKLL